MAMMEAKVTKKQRHSSWLAKFTGGAKVIAPSLGREQGAGSRYGHGKETNWYVPECQVYTVEKHSSQRLVNVPIKMFFHATAQTM